VIAPTALAERVLYVFLTANSKDRRIAWRMIKRASTFIVLKRRRRCRIAVPAGTSDISPAAWSRVAVAPVFKERVPLVRIYRLKSPVGRSGRCCTKASKREKERERERGREKKRHHPHIKKSRAHYSRTARRRSRGVLPSRREIRAAIRSLDLRLCVKG